METSIRFVRVGGKMVKPALCFRGKNQAHAVVNDDTAIRVISNIPLAEHDRSSIVLGPHGLGHREYPVDKFVERFLSLGENKPITKRATYMLKRALEGGIPDDEVLPPDELPSGSQTGRIVSPSPVGPPQAVPRSPKPDKPVASSSGGNSTGPVRTAGSDLIRTLSAELKLEPPKLRKLLRSKGLSAPYTDEKLIRSKL